MRVLAIDTCFEACQAAVWDSEAGLLSLRRELMDRGHAEALYGLIADAAAEAGTNLKAIDRYAVTTGPGSFTGVRVGLAAARGLALAAGRPVVGFTTLEAQARAAAPATAVAAVQDAKRGELYIAAYRGADCLLPPEAVTLDQAGVRLATLSARHGPLRLTGSGARLMVERPDKSVIVSDVNQIDCAFLAGLAAAAPDPGRRRPSALYLRAPDAKLPGGASPPPGT